MNGYRRADVALYLGLHHLSVYAPEGLASGEQLRLEVSRDCTHWYFTLRPVRPPQATDRFARWGAAGEYSAGRRSSVKLALEGAVGNVQRYLPLSASVLDPEVLPIQDGGGLCIRVPFSELGCTNARMGAGRKEELAMAEDTQKAVTRIVQCEFSGSPGKRYAYYTSDPSIAEGDYVVVVSPYDGQYSSRGVHFDPRAGGHPVVVRVVSVDETVEAIERVVKWIVCRVDMGAYRARVEAEERIGVLRARIKKAEAEARKRLELEQLRGLSPELGSLLDELKALGG